MLLFLSLISLFCLSLRGRAYIVALQERGDELVDLEIGEVLSEADAVAGAELEREINVEEGELSLGLYVKVWKNVC